MNNVYEIPKIIKESANGETSISLASKAYSERKIYLFGEINSAMLYMFTLQMLTLMEENMSEIDIYINSCGGEINSGLAIYDIIQSCELPINMYCIGMAASMGALLFASGQKGRRYILPHSKVMIHEPLISTGVAGSATSIKNTAESILETKRLLNEILAKHTGRTLEEINRATDHDNYMKAEEAIEFGLCDEIVTKI